MNHSICTQRGTERAENCYPHVANSECKQNDITFLWHQGVPRDRSFENKPGRMKLAD
jgi:hypothetical protein